LHLEVLTYWATATNFIGFLLLPRFRAYLGASTPRVHGSAKPQRIIEAVLHAKAQYPSFGKQRLANVLYHQGIVISPNTVQRILRKHSLSVPPVPCPPRSWSAFEALAPHVLWAMDICYLYTRKQDGFDRYLITILD